MSEWYLNPVGGYALVSVIGLGLVLLLTFLGLPRQRLTPGRRATLFGLRLAVLLLLLFALLRPTLVHTETKKQRSTLVILIDSSRSMSVADSFNGLTRWAALRRVLSDAQPELRDLAENLEIKVFTFDSELHEVPLVDGRVTLDDKPLGEQTAIGSSLEEMLRREARNRLAGVILLSDGTQRALAPRDVPPQTPARRLADLGYPLYAMAFGQGRGAGQTADVALRDLGVNPTVYVKNTLTVTATARDDGFINRQIPVQLLFGVDKDHMAVVDSMNLQAKTNGEVLPITMSFAPQTPGEYKITLRAEKQDGELLTTNNELSSFVTVLKGGLNVLYLEGALRVEQKFLRRSLDASADINVDYLRLDERNPHNRPFDLIPRFQRGKYDVYIVGDLDSTAFTKEELEALTKVVHDGAGLLMLGGYHAFGPGGWQKTPLADLMPMKMDDLERQHFDEPIRPDVHLAGPLKMQPAPPLGTRHFVMSLGPDNLAAWSKLPALEGANRLGEVKRAAQILAETADHKPLLLTQEAGGRVMVFAADSTWHWWLQGHETAHKRFWRQAALWLARKDELTDGSVWVKLAERRFSPSGRVEFTAGARDSVGEPLTDATFKAEVILPDGTHQPLRLTRQGVEAVGAISQTAAAGDYTVVVTAEHAGAQHGQAKARFLVYEQDLELDNPVADPSLLASLSQMTKSSGGQSPAPEEFPKLLEYIKQQPLEEEVQHQVKDTPWDTWPFFGLFVGLLCTDWYFRKKWGLV